MHQANRPQDVNQQFGVTMRQHRAAAGLSQRKVSELLAEIGVKLDPSAVTRIETSQREPKLAEAIAISEVLGFTLDELRESRSAIFYTRLASVHRYMAEARSALKKAIWHAHAAMATAPPDVLADYKRSFDPVHELEGLADVFREEFDQFRDDSRDNARPRKVTPSADVLAVETDLIDAATAGLLDEEIAGGIRMIHASELDGVNDAEA